MKKVLLIILGLLCTFSAFAIGYATPYKGTTRSGYMHMTSSAQGHSIGSGGGSIAQAPTASMRSTSSTSGVTSTIASVSIPSIPVVQGIRTSASHVSGGVTSTTTYAQMHGAHKAKQSGEGPGLPEGACKECHWEWNEELGVYVCTVCGSYSNLGCDHMYEEGYCWCPITDGWQVWVFMGALAAAYVVYKTVKKKETQTT